MRLVVIESPYAGDVAENERYARACMRDCIERGEQPYASHLLFTQPGILRDDVPEERVTGMLAGFAWAEKADARVVYTDRGTSRGMQAGIDHAREIGQRVEYRSLGGEWKR